MSARRPSRGFPLIQALRAGAAGSVATTHILHDALAAGSGHPALIRLYHAMPWGAGVDVFFVISGFVIAHSSRGLFAQSGAWRLFLARRIARIVPLYWAATTLFLLQYALSPGTIHGDIGGAAYIAKSYAFLPAPRPSGLIQPPLGLGWTLNYEMFFYAVFAPFLLLPRRLAVPGAAGLLALFVLAGQAHPLPGLMLRFWANPIILEFCAGMLLAFLPGRLTLPAPLRALLALAALAALHFNMQESGARFVLWGLPAAALVLAASTGRQAARLPALERWAVRLGDASYALYLIHPFVMRGVDVLCHGLLARPLLYAALCLILAQIAALLVHSYFERPATAWARARLEPAPLSESASGRSPG